MNTNEAVEAQDDAYNRAVGNFLLNKLRAAPPPALANARRPEEAARALATVEAVLVGMSEGSSLEDSLAWERRKKPVYKNPYARDEKQKTEEVVRVYDRDDVAELRTLALQSRDHHREMKANLRRGRETIISRGVDHAEAERWVAQMEAHHVEAELFAVAEVAQYDEMLATDATSWCFEPRRPS